MRKVVGRFSADGSDGRAYSVEIVKASEPGDVPGAVSGPMKLYTANGQPVTRVCQGEYRVDATGVSLTSVARTAP